MGLLEDVEECLNGEEEPHQDEWVTMVKALVVRCRLVEDQLETVLLDAECGNYIPPWKLIGGSDED